MLINTKNAATTGAERIDQACSANTTYFNTTAVAVVGIRNEIRPQSNTTV